MPNNPDAEPGAEKQIFEFHFRGHAEIHYLYKEKDDVNLAKLLNKGRVGITDDISSSVESALHQYGIPAKAYIEFFEGSIEWIGVVALFVSGANLLSSISGTVDFFDKAAKMIEFAIESSIRRFVSRQGVRIQEGSFRINVVQPIVIAPPQPEIPAPQPDKSLALLLERLHNWQRDQIRYMQLVIQNQNVILEGFVKAEAEKQKLRQYIIGLVAVLFIFILYLLFR